MESGFIENLIEEIAREYGTRDVYQIAGKAGVSIIYESWHPATVGEFERKTKTIRVNRSAPGKAVQVREPGNYLQGTVLYLRRSSGVDVLHPEVP